MASSLDGKSVVILGGSSGIGLATAASAMDEGANVIVTGRDRGRLDHARQSLGAQLKAVQLDAADEAGTQQLFDELADLDHVFITAGQLVMDGHLEPDSATLRPAMDVRFWGALYAAKYAARKMHEGGSITFMSGGAGLRPLAGASVASASCGAVNAFARALALDLAPLRVNTISPGYIDTPLFDKLLGDQRDPVLAAAAETLPVKRIGRADEIADAVLFLMKNGYVTGINLVVDGGGLLV